jgi:hypothetical protein
MPNQGALLECVRVCGCVRADGWVGKQMSERVRDGDTTLLEHRRVSEVHKSLFPVRRRRVGSRWQVDRVGAALLKVNVEECAQCVHGAVTRRLELKRCVIPAWARV